MARYDVPDFFEDKWHASSGAATAAFVSKQLAVHNGLRGRLLNAGSGVYQISASGFDEVLLDLFATPIRGQPAAVCGDVEALPFEAGSFECVVAVGEVLAYCDPANAIAEFARVLKPGGLLICDYSSSKSSRYWLTQSFGRAADLVVDIYNNSPERCWIYSPAYVEALLESSGLRATEVLGMHTVAGICRRGGLTPPTALRIQSAFDWLRLPARWADLITIAAVRQRT